MLTLTDLFCGAGGSSTGAVQVPGVSVRVASNHWDLAVETHEVNHPDTGHVCADLSQIDPRYYPKTDILWASPECFTAGHLVTTLHDGQVPIEDIRVGDQVMTHAGRFMPVTRIQTKLAEQTIIVRGQGHTGIECTPNHSFWARRSRRAWQNDIRQYRREYGSADWMRADALVDESALWATPIRWDLRDQLYRTIPTIFGTGATAAWLLGRWLGDGSLTFGRNSEVVISCAFDEREELESVLARTGSDWKVDVKRTALNFRIGNPVARDWLERECGRGAAQKGAPTWTLLWPAELRRDLLDGYMSADGGVTQRRHRASTVSRRLAVSMRLLAESLGHRVAMAIDKRTSYSIEGRTGDARPQWIIHWEPQLNATRSGEAFEEGVHAWSRVRKTEAGRSQVQVYNIEVAEDHSYVLDGIVVKNCTNHSIAKGAKRAPQADLFNPVPDEAAERSRATMWDVPRFTEVHRYSAVIVENVVDVARWHPYRAWLMAMDSLGYEHEVVYMNSMHAWAGGAAAPQSRDRFYAIFWRKGNRRPDLQSVQQPPAWCPEHGQVRAVKAWKNAARAGRYRQQYRFMCPETSCKGRQIEPQWLPAASIIDWSDLGQRIGDRARPLAEKTMKRIQAGIDRYWTGHERDPLVVNNVSGSDSTRSSPVHDVAPTMVAGGLHASLLTPALHLEAAGNTYDSADPKRGGDYYRIWPESEPMRTMHTTASKGVAFAPFIAELRGGGSDARSTTQPLATVTASGNHHALIAPYYGTGTATTSESPLPTVTTVDRHALIMRNNQGGAEMTTPATEPVRTVTTAGHQSLLTGGTPAIEDCSFRMLTPDEIKQAMAFPAAYRILGTKRDQVKMAGNAVTPPAARDLISAVAASLEVAS